MGASACGHPQWKNMALGKGWDPDSCPFPIGRVLSLDLLSSLPASYFLS